MIKKCKNKKKKRAVHFKAVTGYPSKHYVFDGGKLVRRNTGRVSASFVGVVDE